MIIRKGTPIKINIPNMIDRPSIKNGDLGTVTRTDPGTGWRFVTLKRHRKDPAYKNAEFGPFTDSELEIQR